MSLISTFIGMIWRLIIEWLRGLPVIGLLFGAPRRAGGAE